MARVLALIATIPARRTSCERLFGELALQRRKPDGVLLALDAYGNQPAPASPLPVVAEHRTSNPSGCGVRWRAFRLAPEGPLEPDDILITVDDDYMLREAPGFITKLAGAVENSSGAAAAMGFTPDGKRAPPGHVSRGDLIFGAGCGFAIRAAHLDGIRAFAAEINTAGGPDALGLHGNDDAIVSAYCWKNRVRIAHAATGIIHAAPNTRPTSQTAARLRKGEDLFAQHRQIKALSGWPWPVA